MEFLVPDLLFLIFDNLTLSELIKNRQVCTKWRKLINSKYNNSTLSLSIHKDKYFQEANGIYIQDGSIIQRIEDPIINIKDKFFARKVERNYPLISLDSLIENINKFDNNSRIGFVEILCFSISALIFEIIDDTLIITVSHPLNGEQKITNYNHTDTEIKISGNEFKILKLLSEIVKYSKNDN